MSIQVEKLRCTHCGAPLPQPKQGESFIKCEYCGFLNRVLDSAAYIDQLKREISKWISQILPQQVIVSTTADPVARHHVFQGYVKPRLIPVSVNAKTKYVETIYKSFIVLNPVYKVDCAEPRTLFEESVKVETVSELAISDEDRAFLGEVQRHLLLTAHICNAVKDAYEEKYSESVKNVEESISLADKSEDKALVARLKIAKSVYVSLSELYNRNTSSALSIIKSAETMLEELIRQRGDPAITKHQAPLEIEKDLVELVKCAVEISHLYFENGLDPLTPVPLLKKTLAYVANNAERYNRPLKDVSSMAELWKKTVLSRFGREKVKVLGNGDVFIPFYAVSTNITYTSGLIFKKGQETKIDMLVSAIPPVFHGLTDVFGAYSGRIVNLDKEQVKLANVNEMLKNTREDYLKKSAALPLISGVIAEIIADKYLEAVKTKYGSKLKLTTTQARELVYVGLNLKELRAETPLSMVLFSSNLSNLKEILV